MIVSPHQDSGLCNRLKCMVSALRIGEQTSRQVFLHWEKTYTMGADFSELFDSPIIKKEGNEIKGLEAVPCRTFEEGYGNTPCLLIDTWRFLLKKGEVADNFARVYPEKDTPVIDLEYERVPEEVKNEFLPYFKKLVPADSLRKEIESFSQEKDIPNAIGIHARRTEFLMNADGRGQVSTDERFFEAMENMGKDKKFFLATDSKETEKNFIKRFGERVIVFPKKNWNKDTRRSMEEAVIDLFLLSKTRYILGTYMSTFTEVAWWLGGCKAKVEIMGDPKKMQEVLMKSQQAGKSSPLSRPIRELFKIIRRKSRIFRYSIDFAVHAKMRLQAPS